MVKLWLVLSPRDVENKKRKEKTTPSGVDLMISQVLYQAAQGKMC